MKVKLATQLFSNSVAVAMNICRTDPEFGEEVNKEFAESEATEIFVKNMNDPCDLLNTSSKFDPCPTRNPITLGNLAEVRLIMDRLITYLKEIEFVTEVRVKTNKSKNNSQNNVPVSAVLNSKGKLTYKAPTVLVRFNVTKHRATKTGFDGLIICLTNIYVMARELLENKYLDYLLAYKLSQDHVELIFSRIRRKNGTNTNPTTLQFKSALKKIMYHR